MYMKGLFMYFKKIHRVENIQSCMIAYMFMYLKGKLRKKRKKKTRKWRY